jgi:hypothetical protein
MNNIHTCTVGRPDLVIAIVMFMHDRNGVEVPVWIGSIGTRHHSSKMIVGDELFIKFIMLVVCLGIMQTWQRGLDYLLEESVDDPGHCAGLE